MVLPYSCVHKTKLIIMVITSIHFAMRIMCILERKQYLLCYDTSSYRYKVRAHYSSSIRPKLPAPFAQTNNSFCSADHVRSRTEQSNDYMILKKEPNLWHVAHRFQMWIVHANPIALWQCICIISLFLCVNM